MAINEVNFKRIEALDKRTEKMMDIICKISRTQDDFIDQFNAEDKIFNNGDCKEVCDVVATLMMENDAMNDEIKRLRKKNKKLKKAHLEEFA